MRVLIAYEERYRTYGDAIESAIKGLRPRMEVAACQLQECEVEVERFDPHLVVSSQPNELDLGGRPAWVRLSPEPDEASELCLDGQSSVTENPGLGKMLTLIDQMEELAQEGRDLGGC